MESQMSFRCQRAVKCLLSCVPGIWTGTVVRDFWQSRRRVDLKRRVFLVETRMRRDQFSAVALPFKVEPRDARGTRLVG
jgi:hypothetical protein